MSQMSTSLDLTEFFNDDDSQGLGLLEFLKKRRGNGQRQNFLFVNCEMERMSLEVQLEKLPPSQKETICKNDIENVKEKEHDSSEAIINSTENQMLIQEVRTGETLPLEPNAEESFGVIEDPGNAPQLPIQPLSPISPKRLQNPSPTHLSSLLKPLSPRPLIQRFSSVHKSGGRVSPGDRLRRYSLKKQLVKHCGGRRTLLKEFESTIDESNFEPPSCSTPLSQPQSKSPEKSSSINISCCRNTEMLVKTLQRKDDELKKYMDSILENTLKQSKFQEKENNKCISNNTNTNDQAITTPVKPTSTFENSAAQVIFSPDKSEILQRLRRSLSLRLQTKPLQSKIKNTQPQNSNPQGLSQSTTQLGSRSYSESYITHKCSKSRSFGHQQKERLSPNLNAALFELPNTSLERNVTLKLPVQNVETHVGENTILIKSNNAETVVVVPVNQTFNRSCRAEAVSNNTAEKDKTKQSDTLSILSTQQTHLTGKNNDVQCTQIAETKQSDTLSILSTQQTHLTGKNNDVQCTQIAEDNLKLSDILTEDEGETPKAAALQTVEDNSEIPLNLAPSATNLRSKRLHKRYMLRRRLQMDNLHLNDTETETDELHQAHSSKRMTKKKQIPLNKAPGTPLNGEKFAQELARMSNCEILDLRKRNSIGRVFVKSGRRSRRSQENAVKKQHLLDEQIEKELLRRNMNEISEKQQAQSDEANVGDVENITRRDDSLAQQNEIRNDSRYSSLVDEKPTDRVSFKTNKSNRCLNKNKKKNLPEELKQYLKVTKTLSQKRSKFLNRSKRSLYTQGNSQSEDTNSSVENLAEKNTSSKNKENGIPSYLLSPPKSDGKLITTMRVSSSQPPITVTCNSKREQHQQIATNEDLYLHDKTTNLDNNVHLPPPPGFDNDSEIEVSHKIIDPSPTNSNFQSENVITSTTYLNTNHNTNDEDNLIFKKPQKPAPKKTGRKRKVPLNDITTHSQQLSTNSDDTTESTLRRSKRGHVPLIYPSIFNLLQKSLERQSQNIGKKPKKQNSTVNTIKSNSNPTKSTEKGSKQNKNPVISEDGVTNKEKQTKNKESRTKGKKTKNYEETIRPNEILNCTPPVYHINDVFDQLRNTSSRLTTPPTTTIATLPLKTKPFRVRVARLKSSTQSVDCDSVSTVSSTSSRNSNHELISWLKNIKLSNTSAGRNSEISKLVRISSACRLSFTELQGVEYAFYDTDEKAFLGYLRFKPHQKKPRKKTKRFHLHFVILLGNFRITIGETDHLVGVGDMVAIEKWVYYDIENVSDEIGILMVIKK